MLTILGKGDRYCDGVSRRSFLKIGGLAMGGISLPQLLRAEAQAGQSNPHKAIIMLLLPGGPPHLDMYDLKPDAPVEIRGEFKPIQTSVPGIEICEHRADLFRPPVGNGSHQTRFGKTAGPVRPVLAPSLHVRK